MKEYLLVTDVTVVEKTIEPPLLFNLTTLQIEANRLFGLSAAETLACAQALYENELITYPRTSSQYVTSDMGEKVISLLSGENSSGQISGDGCSSIVARLINDSQVADHSALLPIKKRDGVNLGNFHLNRNQRKVLDLVYQNLEDATSGPYKYEETIVTISCAGELFTVTGKRNLELGWIKNYPEKAEERMLPIFQKDEKYEIEDISIIESQTSPPKHYTEGTLLHAMEAACSEENAEKHSCSGIGTPATRAEIIEKLKKYGFIDCCGDGEPEKNLAVTELGSFLSNILPDSIKSVNLTSDWEAKLQQIENGLLDPQVFYEQIYAYINTICKDAVDARATAANTPVAEGAISEDKYSESVETDSETIVGQSKSFSTIELARFFCKVRPESLKPSDLIDDWEERLSGKENGTLAPEIPLEQIINFVETTLLNADEDAQLSQEGRYILQNGTGWSEAIVDNIASVKQAGIYVCANLTEVEIRGRKCLIKDIDLDYVDPKTGKTNRELMRLGRPPIDSTTGERLELHHIGQEYNSPFAELCENSEHGDGKDTMLHDKKKESWRQDKKLKNRYNNKDRPEHWVERINKIESEV